MRRVLTLLLLVTFTSVLSAQEFNLNTLVQPYNTRIQADYWNAEVIVVIGNKAPDKNLYLYAINRAKKEAQNYQVKRESELTKPDLEKHLLLYGLVSWYDSLSYYNIPFQKTEKGFKLSEYVFDSPYDEFWVLNSQRTCWANLANSMDALNGKFEDSGPAWRFDYRITQKGKRTVWGKLN